MRSRRVCNRIQFFFRQTRHQCVFKSKSPSEEGDLTNNAALRYVLGNYSYEHGSASPPHLSTSRFSILLAQTPFPSGLAGCPRPSFALPSASNHTSCTHLLLSASVSNDALTSHPRTTPARCLVGRWRRSLSSPLQFHFARYSVSKSLAAPAPPPSDSASPDSFRVGWLRGVDEATQRSEPFCNPLSAAN